MGSDPRITEFAVFGEWLAERVDGCTCAGGTPESSYLHEPNCGWGPLAKLSDIVNQEQRIAAAEQKLRTEKAGAAEAMLHFTEALSAAEAELAKLKAQRWDGDEVTEAALTAIAAETDLPYMVRSERYSVADALAAADEEADRLNHEFAARVVSAVLQAAAATASENPNG